MMTDCPMAADEAKRRAAPESAQRRPAPDDHGSEPDELKWPAVMPRVNVPVTSMDRKALPEAASLCDDDVAVEAGR